MSSCVCVKGRVFQLPVSPLWSFCHLWPCFQDCTTTDICLSLTRGPKNIVTSYIINKPPTYGWIMSFCWQRLSTQSLIIWCWKKKPSLLLDKVIRELGLSGMPLGRHVIYGHWFLPSLTVLFGPFVSLCEVGQTYLFTCSWTFLPNGDTKWPTTMISSPSFYPCNNHSVR